MESLVGLSYIGKIGEAELHQLPRSQSWIAIFRVREHWLSLRGLAIADIECEEREFSNEWQEGELEL